MQVHDVMDPRPACCVQQSRLRNAAKTLVVHDIGAWPVVGGIGQRIAVVIDRDIGVRGMVQGRSEETRISEITSDDIVTVSPQADLETCCDRLERPKLRRVILGKGRMLRHVRPSGYRSPSRA